MWKSEFPCLSKMSSHWMIFFSLNSVVSKPHPNHSHFTKGNGRETAFTMILQTVSIRWVSWGQVIVQEDARFPLFNVAIDTFQQRWRNRFSPSPAIIVRATLSGEVCWRVSLCHESMVIVAVLAPYASSSLDGISWYKRPLQIGVGGVRWSRSADAMWLDQYIQTECRQKTCISNHMKCNEMWYMFDKYIYSLYRYKSI